MSKNFSNSKNGCRNALRVPNRICTLFGENLQVHFFYARVFSCSSGWPLKLAGFKTPNPRQRYFSALCVPLQNTNPGSPCVGVKASVRTIQAWNMGTTKILSKSYFLAPIYNIEMQEHGQISHGGDADTQSFFI